MPIEYEATRYKKKKVLIIKTIGEMVDNDLSGYVNFMNNNLDNIEKFKCIFDLREMSTAPISLIKALANYMKENRQRFKEKLECSVIIVNSILVRGFLNLLFTFVEPVSPYYITTKLEDINEYLVSISISK